MSASVLQDLLARAPVLTDGAWGTELALRGLDSSSCPDSWNLSHPEQVMAVAAAYVRAGSQVILTNTFRANRIALAGFGLEGKTAEINRAGASLSRQAAGDQALVFASMGPSGKLLFHGETTEEELETAFREQAEALAEGGAHGLVLETFSDLEEIHIALKAARRTGLPVVASLAFDSGKYRDRTMMGVTPEQAAKALEEDGADVVGANCGQGIEGYIPICYRLRTSTGRPIWIKANAGLPEIVDGQLIYRTTPEEFARHLPELLKAGATFVGGCCGTSPAYIEASSRCLRGLA